ncbi:MAG TPA: biotin/lipoyl-containing protein [Opitutaceae bacterium]|nr:biotin/lipoyl-containing protein [Opitutaceae bacterium]
MKKLRVTVDGKKYEVLVEVLDERASVATVAPPPSVSTSPPQIVMSAPVAAPAVTATPHGAGPGDVTSPLAGKLVSIDVQLGQSVAEGAQVATVEAMKMNTYIFAPKTGRVAEIAGKAGDAVQEGSVLLKIA